MRKSLGADTPVIVKTRSGQISQKSQAIDNLRVAKSLGSRKPKWIKLLRTKKKEKLLVYEEEIETPEKLILRIFQYDCLLVPIV